MKAILVAVACLFAVVASIPTAMASTITFGTYNGPNFEVIGSTYEESGYRFYNPGLFSRWENGTTFDSDPTSSTALGTWTGGTTLITRINGGAFDLISMDFDDVYNSGTPGSVDYEYGYANGGTGNGTLGIDGNPGLSTVLFNLANLSYFQFFPSSGLPWVHFDNAVVSGADTVVPIPAALPLFASALGVLGWMARRRSRTASLSVGRAV